MSHNRLLFGVTQRSLEDRAIIMPNCMSFICVHTVFLVGQSNHAPLSSGRAVLFVGQSNHASSSSGRAVLFVGQSNHTPQQLSFIWGHALFLVR